MIDSDKADFEGLLRGIADVFSTTKTIVVNRPMLQVYFMSLTEYSYEQVEWAIGEHLKDSLDGKFFPKPANIIKHLQANELSPEEKAELAWAQISREIRVTGSYGNLKLDDKQALASLQSFTTWKELCKMDVTKMTWAKKEFIGSYSTYDKTPLDMLPSSLPGRVELVEHKQNDTKSLNTILDKLKDMNNG
tara:strand:+ start:1170 stop:1742 length:573 start_codon:yes stop_codon:yes gene_type:complete